MEPSICITVTFLHDFGVIKREQVGELFEKEMGTEKGNFDPTPTDTVTKITTDDTGTGTGKTN